MIEAPYSDALFVDLYELTMAQAAWRSGLNDDATFSLFFRGYQPDRSYYAVAGVDAALDQLESLRFSEADLEYLRTGCGLDPEFVDTLTDFSFIGSVRAVPEGTVLFADEPVLEVTARFIDCLLLETMLLNAITFPTTVLTKAVRINQATEGRGVVEFGARRAQGSEAADIASRCALIAGFGGTSNLRAAARFELPPVGTMAHAFVQAFPNELAAFRAYADSFPESTTLLVDTYDTLDGVRNAITVGRELERDGSKLAAIRLDSGDLLELSNRAREMLDEAGLDYVRIVASGGLDEHSISDLVKRGAPVDSFGVGTRYVVAADAPYSDSVYKLVEFAGSGTRKNSPGKQTLPGPKQVFRLPGRDLIGTADETVPEGAEPLLFTKMESGRRIAEPESLNAIKTRLSEQLGKLSSEVRRLRSPERHPVELTPALRRLAEGE